MFCVVVCLFVCSIMSIRDLRNFKKLVGPVTPDDHFLTFSLIMHLAQAISDLKLVKRMRRTQPEQDKDIRRALRRIRRMIIEAGKVALANIPGLRDELDDMIESDVE